MIVLLIEPTNFPPLSKTGTAKYPEPVNTSKACSKGLFNCTCATFSEGIINSSIVICVKFFSSLVVLIDLSPFELFTKHHFISRNQYSFLTSFTHTYHFNIL